MNSNEFQFQFCIFIAKISKQQSSSNCRMYVHFFFTCSQFECPSMGTSRQRDWIYGKTETGVPPNLLCNSNTFLGCGPLLLGCELFHQFHRTLEQDEEWRGLPQDVNADVQVTDCLSGELLMPYRTGKWTHCRVFCSPFVGTTRRAWS